MDCIVCQYTFLQDLIYNYPVHVLVYLVHFMRMARCCRTRARHASKGQCTLLFFKGGTVQLYRMICSQA